MYRLTDASITGDIKVAVQQLLPALGRFVPYQLQDLAAHDCPVWRDTLDKPFLQQSVGAEATLQVLREEMASRKESWQKTT